MYEQDNAKVMDGLVDQILGLTGYGSVTKGLDIEHHTHGKGPPEGGGATSGLSYILLNWSDQIWHGIPPHGEGKFFYFDRTPTPLTWARRVVITLPSTRLTSVISNPAAVSTVSANFHC